MKAVVAAFNQEKALVGAFSVLMNLRMELFQALLDTHVVVTARCTPRVTGVYSWAAARWSHDPEQPPSAQLENRQANNMTLLKLIDFMILCLSIQTQDASAC